MKLIRMQGLLMSVILIYIFIHYQQGGYSRAYFTDKDFIIHAWTGGLMEVKLGKAAQIQSDNRRVKDYGIMMDHDHTLANDELKSIAENKNIELPDKPDDKHQQSMDRLKDKSGVEFDKYYMEMMVEDHTADIREFEEAVTGVSDKQLKKFVINTLPLLKLHLDSANAILKSLK